MPRISKTASEPTLYEILSLTPKHLEGQAASAQQRVVKQAYHKALLKYHPDKNNNAASSGSGSDSPSKPQPKSKSKSKSTTTKTSSSSTPNSNSDSSPITYTVDQIQHAYTILSDSKTRSEYTRSLQTSQKSISTRHRVSTQFHTGVETVDLDDVGFDERRGVYFRSCRCGNARGYAFTEDNLEEVEDDGVLMVECLDCSLWLRVLFTAAAPDDDDEEEDQGNVTATRHSGKAKEARMQQQQPPQQMQQQRNDVTSERRGSGAVKKKGRGWNFNFSFGWGLSVGGSASASGGSGN
ncbi:Uu.00g043620.m01.CDS01 [Anthostomella pinea]|uniref:Diphthamide biosynthesis protein 4 n=1 Tax=Anthostomella pinea TaxID=933095 RepID=A0AAI8YBU5_9PEZI|nr:Uu.00g043620.m01.CDS01 [Anthostomella pinea]